MGQHNLYRLILSVQVVCASFFVWNIVSSILGFHPIAWQFSEYIELGAALGLLIGVGLGARLLRIGPVTLSCRPRCSFKPPFVRRRQGFSSPELSGGVADCRSR